MSDMTKTVLVTGGAKRIGAAIVRDLAANGFAVAIHCHNSRDNAEALQAEIVAEGGKAAVVTCDLTEPSEVRGLISEAERAIGPIHLLVNNASIFRNDSITNLDMRSWDDHFSVHLKAPALLTSDLARLLPADATGMVVNIIDQRVWRLTPKFFSYTLSKSALWTATRTMAQALAPRIRVNAIAPGPAMANERQTEEDFARQQSAVPLGLGPDPREFGATIRWLWDAPSVTGQMIALDGGQHLAWQTPDVTSVRE